jgi:calcineurin-like phosphoesterase family protein
MRKAPSPDYWMKYFESVSPMSSIRDSGALVTLCHYPMMSWQGSGRGGYMVFGHIHNNTNASFWPLIRGSPLMLNAGVDINGFKPATLSELKNNNEIFKLSRPDIPCERAGNPENNEDGDEYE